MNSKANSFNTLARFDPVLTRIDPALDVDVFNKFMQHLPIAPQSTASNEKPLIRRKADDVKSLAV